MVSFRKNGRLPGGIHPLKRLQGVQEEIFRQLQLLIPDAVAFHDALKSQVSGSPTLRMQVLERHPYTTFLRLTYEFRDGDDRSYAPDAHIRLYRDARLAEATSYNTEQGCTRDAHPSYPGRHQLIEAWRRNRALDRWLNYLLTQGHSLSTMRPARDELGGSEPGVTLQKATQNA